MSLKSTPLMFFTNVFFLQVAPTVAVDGILANLAKEGPLVSIFILISIYLAYQIFNKDKQIAELNAYIRTSDKENLEMMNDVTNTLDKVFEQQKGDKETILREISSLKEWIVLNKLNK